MATELKYYITKEGYFLDSESNQLSDGRTNAIHFTSAESASLFVEANSTDGEYIVHCIIDKIE